MLCTIQVWVAYCYVILVLYYVFKKSARSKSRTLVSRPAALHVGLL